MRIVSHFALCLTLMVWPAKSQNDANAACVEHIRIPDYPPAARDAQIDGTVKASLLLSAIASVHAITIEVHSNYGGASRLLAPPVEAAVRGGMFRRACSGKMLDLVFHFELRRNLTRAIPQQTLSTGYPNQFWIESELRSFKSQTSRTTESPAGTAAVSGRLTSLGWPESVPYAHVSLRHPGSAAIVATAQTDTMGRFAFPPVLAGTYELIVADRGYVPVSRRIEAAAGETIDIVPIIMNVADVGEGGIEAATPPPFAEREPIPVTPCDLTRNPTRYLGKVVQVRGQFHPTGLDSPATISDLHCGTSITLAEPPGTDSLALRRGSAEVIALGKFEYVLLLGGRSDFRLSLQSLSDQ